MEWTWMHISPPIRQSDQVRLAHAVPAGLRSAIESERQELLGLLSDLDAETGAPAPTFRRCAPS